MAKLLKKIPCPECGSSKTPALAVYQNEDGTVTGWCFACGTYHNDPLESNPEIEKEEPISIPNYPIKALGTRKINEEVASKYKVRTEFSTDTGEPIAYYYPLTSDGEEVAYKVRKLKEKDFLLIGNKKTDLDLFGQSLWEKDKKHKKAIVLTEGQDDAMAAYQMFKASGKIIPCVSVVNGSNDLKSIQRAYNFLNSYNSIYICSDMDEPGKKFRSAVAKLFDPGKCKLVDLPLKDANDMLLAGREKEFIQAFREASSFAPDGVVKPKDLESEVLQDIEQGLTFPWPSLTEVTYGYRRREIHGIGAGSGSGKSTFVKELAYHIVSENNLPVGMILLEEPPARTLKELAGKAMNKLIHIPGTEYNKDDLKKALKKFDNKVFLYDHFGAKDWEAIKNVIKYFVRSLGIKDIILDHLTALVAQEDDEYRAMNKIMEDLASLSQALDCTIFYISHLRKSEKTPHEEGGRVSMNQFKGSGAISFWSHFMYGLERDSQAEDEDQRNTVKVRVLKDRNTGLATGKVIHLKYNRETGRLLEEGDEDLLS